MVRTLVILKEDPGSVPPASTRQLRDIHNFSSEESNTLFRLLQAPGTLVVEKKKKKTPQHWEAKAGKILSSRPVWSFFKKKKRLRV